MHLDEKSGYQDFQIMADSAPVLIWMCGTDRKYTYFNKQWLDFTGRTLAEEKGEGWTERIHPEDLEIYFDEFSRAFEQKKPFKLELRLMRADGDYVWVLNHGMPLFLNDGTFVGYVGSAVDISDRKKVEQLKDEFISTVSHELRTPLAIVQGAVNNLRDGIAGALNEIQTKVVHVADKNIVRLSRLINDLLDLSRLESGNARVNLRTVKPFVYFTEAIGFFNEAAKKKDITITMGIDKNLPAIYADPDMCTQVINNLMSNAIRYAHKTINVTLELSREDPGYLLCCFNNDGETIPPNEVGHVFDKFIQINRPMGGAGYKGTGLGLAICRDIIQMHRGKIWVASHPDQGTSFFILLPLYNEEKHFWEYLRGLINQSKQSKTPLHFFAITLENIRRLKTRCDQGRLDHIFDNLVIKLRKGIIRQPDHIFYYATKCAIIICAETENDGAETIVQRLKNMIKKNIFYESDLDCDLRFCLGHTTCPQDADDAHALVNFAIKAGVPLGAKESG